MIQLAAYISTLIFIGLGIFQFMLILGYPLGEYAWGGQQKTLNRSLKIGSVVAILIYVFMVSILLDKSGIINIYEGTFIREYVYWVMVGYLGLGILGNAASRSKKERYTMTPIILLLFLFSLFIGFS